MIQAFVSFAKWVNCNLSRGNHNFRGKHFSSSGTTLKLLVQEPIFPTHKDTSATAKKSVKDRTNQPPKNAFPPKGGFGHRAGWQEARSCAEKLFLEIFLLHREKKDFTPEGSPWLHLHFIGTIYNWLEPKNGNFFCSEETAASFLFLYQKKKIVLNWLF